MKLFIAAFCLLFSFNGIAQPFNQTQKNTIELTKIDITKAINFDLNNTTFFGIKKRNE